MTHEESIAWDQKGWIVGPNETEEEYKKRVAFGSQEIQELQKNIDDELPFIPPSSAKTTYYASPIKSIQAQYDIAPDWVPLLFHNKGLSPWHGGCAWIYTLSDEHPCSAFLQLRRSFAKKDKLWGIVRRDEVIAHEMVHVARMAFEEPRFEELFAYHTSFSRWRRWWGPILQSPWEAHLFLFSIAIPLLCTLVGTFYGIDAVVQWGFGLLIFPLSLTTMGTWRLTYKHNILNKCLKQLSLFLPKPAVWSVALRLTDHEIRRFGKMSPDAIRNYARQNQEFRWKILSSRWGF